MKRISIIAVITLILSLGFASWRVERGAKAEAVPVGAALTANYPLNPNDFSSLGASPFTSAGTYTINASKDNATPSLSGPGIATPIQGVFFSPSGDSVARDEIAVFTFDSLIIPTGVTVQGSQTPNSRPIALLSQSTATIDGTINVSGASAGGPLDSGNGGNAGPGGGGGGGGGSNSGFPGGSGGLGFVNGSLGTSSKGGDGGSVENFAGGGGSGSGGGQGGSFGGGSGRYGDLSLKLQGGSGGGGGGNEAGGGGGGGGAVEIGAVGNVSLGGIALANGGAGGPGFHSGGGGGAGGGILVHAPTVSLSGNLSAIGGGGGASGLSFNNGSGGGGGRVLILTADGTLESGSLGANVNVGGDLGAGTKELKTGSMFNQAPVAQCQSVTVAAGANCTADASIDNGSFDPDSGDTITVTQTPAGPYPLGSTNVTLTVTDSQGLSSSCSAVVTVANSAPPSLGNYPSATVTAGGGANITPDSPPSDNSSISSVAVIAPGFTGTATVDAATGVVSISNAGPIGIFLVTVTATDNCGAQTTRDFTLTVAANTCGVTVNPATLPQPYVGLPYGWIVSATPFGSYTFSVSAGELPPGLQLVTALGVNSIVGLPTTPGTYSFTIKAKKNGAACEATRSYTLTIPATVAPILECVQRNSNGSYTARFGYDNSTGAAVTIPVGANNYFTPGAQNRGQVTVFNPGRVTNAFSVTFNANGGNLGVWILKGPDGVTRPVNVTTASLGCQ